MFEKTFEQMISYAEGGAAQSVSFNDRSVSYSLPRYDELLKTYNRLRPQLISSGEISANEYPDMAQTIGGPLTARFCG